MWYRNVSSVVLQQRSDAGEGQGQSVIGETLRTYLRTESDRSEHPLGGDAPARV